MALSIDELCALGVPPELAAEVIRNAGGGGGSGGSSSTPVKYISASGTTNLAIPASGDVTYLVTPTAAATLQFSGSAASGTSQTLKVLVVGNGNPVTLPESNVVYPDGVAPTVSTTSGDVTAVNYLAVSGAAAIVGGI
ncbi:MAG: hypothetical protein ABF968_04860 [Acetobacter sp.]|uniref:hypothetical protein n=1 Tax=Acetobacter sp. TaxID=440 RepID=UPI0039EC7FF2